MLKPHHYHRIYTKLQRVIPNLEEHLEARTPSGKSQSKGFMDLHFDYLGEEEKGVHKIALSHYYKENGDMVPDPDMEVRIFTELKAAEAMSFQDRWRYDQVYEEQEGKTYMRPKLKEDLNIFLNQWLKNCLDQGHSIVMDVKEVEHGLPGPLIQQQKSDEQDIAPSDELSALRARDDDQEKSNGIER